MDLQRLKNIDDINTLNTNEDEKYEQMLLELKRKSPTSPKADSLEGIENFGSKKLQKKRTYEVTYRRDTYVGTYTFNGRIKNGNGIFTCEKDCEHGGGIKGTVMELSSNEINYSYAFVLVSLGGGKRSKRSRRTKRSKRTRRTKRSKRSKRSRKTRTNK